MSWSPDRGVGLLGQYVQAFTIIDADANKRVVTRTSCPDLLYAVLGGGPGNFGVLTSVTLKVLRDAQYPDSRVLLAIYWYEKQHEQALTELVVQMNADPALPATFSAMVATSDSYNVIQDYLHYGPMMKNEKQYPFCTITDHHLCAVEHGGVR